MAKTRSSYQVPGGSHELNFILARIAERLDKIEGIRGDAKIESSLQTGPLEVLDGDDIVIHSME